MASTGPVGSGRCGCLHHLPQAKHCSEPQLRHQSPGPQGDCHRSVHAQLLPLFSLFTGANVGIGLETARALAAQGAHVTLTCRDPVKAQAAVEFICVSVQSFDSRVAERVNWDTLELSDTRSINDFVDRQYETEGPLHVLVNNAGAIHPDQHLVDGVDGCMMANHLGPTLLTWRLTPLLAKAGTPDRQARIVHVSSRLEKNGAVELWCREPSSACKGKYSGFAAYATSKQANLHLSYELSRILEGTNITSNAVTPGMVNSQLGRFNWWYPLSWPLRKLFLRSSSEGAIPSVYCASSPYIEGVSGAYFGAAKGGVVERLQSSARSRDERLNKQVWAVSDQLLGAPWHQVQPLISRNEPK